MVAIASTVEDDDTKRAFVSAFTNDPGLVAACVGGLRTGSIVSGVIVGQQPATTLPYARIECEQGSRSNEYIAPVVTGVGYHDFRHVTIDIYGARPDVVTVMNHMRRVFEWQPKAANPANANVRTMSIDDAALKRIMPLPGSGKMQETKERVAGNPQWQGTLEFEVWTVRLIP